MKNAASDNRTYLDIPTPSPSFLPLPPTPSHLPLRLPPPPFPFHLPPPTSLSDSLLLPLPSTYPPPPPSPTPSSPLPLPPTPSHLPLRLPPPPSPFHPISMLYLFKLSNVSPPWQPLTPSFLSPPPRSPSILPSLLPPPTPSQLPLPPSPTPFHPISMLYLFKLSNVSPPWQPLPPPSSPLHPAPPPSSPPSAPHLPPPSSPSLPPPPPSISSQCCICSNCPRCQCKSQSPPSQSQRKRMQDEWHHGVMMNGIGNEQTGCWPPRLNEGICLLSAHVLILSLPSSKSTFSQPFKRETYGWCSENW